MKYIGIVHGDAEQAKPLIIGKTTVYVHKNIQEIEVDGKVQYQYEETQYDKDEYLLILIKEQGKEIE